MINLATPIEKIPRVTPQYAKKLHKLGIKTVQDLLFHFPHRYEDYSKTTPLSGIKLNEKTTVTGKILDIKNTRTFRKRMNITEALIGDGTNTIRAVWFNQPFLVRSLKKGLRVNLAGKVSYDGKAPYLSNPVHEVVRNTDQHRQDGQVRTLTIHTGRLVPVYPETFGLSSRWLRYIIRPLLPLTDKVSDVLPKEIKDSQKLLDLHYALKQIHFPDSKNLAEAAKKRLAFGELLLLQLRALRQRERLQKEKALPIPFDEKLIKEFVGNLPFQLTDSQKVAAWQIFKDMEKPTPMNRLLNGDVGSGKTVIAVMAAFQAVKSPATPIQATIMAPTEILARQHFKTISNFLKDYKVSIALITGSEHKLLSKKTGRTLKPSRDNLIQKTSQGKVDIIIGTHALIQDKIKFKNLALVVVDEQHRFGVNQRAKLTMRNKRRINTEQTRKNDRNLLHEDITYKIRSALFDVKKELGGGHKEIIYQRAVADALGRMDLRFSRETQIPIIYKNKKIGTYIPDFIVEDKIILELKALPFIGTAEKKKIWNYLKGSKYQLALLANYGYKELTIDRIIYSSARNSTYVPYNSASDPHSSALVPHNSALVPHLLTMTATPIPRTLALTVYGDLDISLLKEMPKGRQKIITKIVGPQDRQNTYRFIKEEIKKGRQAFVICPRIEKSEIRISKSEIKNKSTLAWAEVKAVKDEYEKLSKKIFPNFKIEMLHGKLPAKGGSASGGKPNKEQVMRDFQNKKTDLLISTSVIEVGIDVPNVTVMMIEGAERFGLAQLHQFRGRVGRGEHQSYCFLFTESSAEKTNQRLKALIGCKDGFALAEKDLKIRGPGEFFGARQSGLPDLAMASLSDVKLIEGTRREASNLLDRDPELVGHPLLREKLDSFKETVHLE